MKLKKEYLILLLVIAALCLYLVLRGEDGSRDLPQPSALESQRIDRILITSADAVLELVKKDEQWIIQPQGYPADPAQVTNMLNTISKLQLTALVSESGNYERYQLAGEKKITVQAFGANAVLREFDVGQVAPTYRHTFVKLAGDSHVYHAQDAFRNNFDKSGESLRDKKVMAFDASAIATLEIRKGDRSVKILKKEITPEPAAESKDQSAAPAAPAPGFQWLDAEGQTTDQGELERLMGTLSGLKCDSFVNDKNKSDFQSALWSITFQDAGNAYTLSVFAKQKQDDSTYPAVSSTSPYVFSLSGSRVESFEKQLDILLGIGAEKVKQN